jgi:Zn-dependent M16 (insulinase) family peptidase
LPIPEPGQTLHGFTVTGREELPELNANLVRLHHGATGARYLHLATADPNNLFAAIFRTPPADSSGVAHILEHTVLCGSRRYPVRDPFFTMLKRSLNTFMNAMTSSDWTAYPFASQNRKDFYNLMEVYLDAAFFPLLRERDFRQEGHRLEFADPADPASPLVHKGVVYNEMKGAMASPSSLLSRRLGRALYPTTCYHHNSGGEPEAILELTWEQLRAFHADYYHPSNAWFFSYGNFPLEGHLELLADRVLRHFTARDVASAIPPEVRFAEPRRHLEAYPLDPGEPAANKTMVQVAWLTSDITDHFERFALGLLSTLLLGNPAAPLYQALIESGLGGNLAPGCGYHEENRTTYFAAGLQATEPERTGAIEALILATLERVAATGFTRERIDAAVHRLEFAHREVAGDHYPYPLGLLMRLLGPWLHGDDPVTPLRLEASLERLRRELDRGPFFSDLIRRHLLANPHRVTLTLSPDTGLGEREERLLTERLETLRGALDPAGRERLLAEARDLEESQQGAEDLSCLPTLDRADIPAEEVQVTAAPHPAKGCEVQWFDQPTNGIGYFIAHLPVALLPPELLATVPLCCSLLTQVGAAGHSYLEMAERLEAATGGLSLGSEILEHPDDFTRYQGLVAVRGKALTRNADRLFELLGEFSTAPDFTDLERLRTVLNHIRTNLDNAIPGSGHSYAARAAAGRLTPAGRQREVWSGLTLIRRVRELADRPAADLAGFAGELQAIARTLFDRRRLACALTSEAASLADFGRPLERYLEQLPDSYGPLQETAAFQPEPARLGWIASVPVNYVTQVFPAVPFTHPDAAPLMALARLLRAGYLHREIREKGGAYGGLAGYDPESGLFSLLSYRDPQIARTLGVYAAASEWAAGGEFPDSAIDEAVLAVFADLDRPLSPGSRGYREFASMRQGLNPELRQQLRERILAVNRVQLKSAAEAYLVAGRSRSAVSVVGGEEALRQANQELGNNGLQVERI